MNESKNPPSGNNVIVYNQQIALHANRKELSKAKEIFARVSDLKIANKHTYATMMNVAIRCGQLAYAESLLQEMKDLKYSSYKDIVIYTTLMKGYCLNHKINKAYSLYNEMLVKPVSLTPNIRALNTILRGCVQNGNLSIAEAVVLQFQKEFHLSLDINSWEYLILLYSQNLMVHKIQPIIGRLKQTASSSSSISSVAVKQIASKKVGEEESGKESEKQETEQQPQQFSSHDLVSIHIYLIKSLLLLNEIKSIPKLCTAVREMIRQYEASVSTSQGESSITAGSATTLQGGKRGWKETTQKNEENKGNYDQENEYILQRRGESLVIYRQHLCEEWKYELSLIENYLSSFTEKSTSSSTTTTVPKLGFEDLVDFYPRLFCFDYEVIETSLTSTTVTSSPRNTFFVSHLLSSLRDKFGLLEIYRHFFNSSNDLVERLFYSKLLSLVPVDTSNTTENKGTGNNDKKKKKKGNSNSSSEQQKHNKKPIAESQLASDPKLNAINNHLSSMLHSFQSYFPNIDSGMLSFDKVFHSTTGGSTDKPMKYKLEICSGNGDWAIEQAKNDPLNGWITIELRTDRVYHTLFKAFLQKIRNLLMISGNALYILPNHIPSSSIHNVFVNHPEPPQQTSSQQFSDADHLLTPVSDLFVLDSTFRYLLPFLSRSFLKK
jgi:pentatricopeptide repeat protein